MCEQSVSGSQCRASVVAVHRNVAFDVSSMLCAILVNGVSPRMLVFRCVVSGFKSKPMQSNAVVTSSVKGAAIIEAQQVVFSVPVTKECGPGHPQWLYLPGAVDSEYFE